MSFLYRNNKLSYADLLCWKHVSVQQVLMCVLSIVLNSPHALAESLDTYCILQRGQRQGSISSSIVAQPVQATFSVSGVLFYVMAAGDNVMLKREKEATPLTEVRVPQYEFGRINALALGDNGWLWIDGDETDYMVLLNKDKALPTFSTPVALPQLYAEPCSFWHRFWNQCRRVQGVYSTTLNRPFITGHRVTFWGKPDLVSFEIIAGEAKLLPEKAHNARFVVDVPKLSGVLLQGTAGEGFFYDGVVITTLLPASSNQSISDTSPKWHVESTRTGRTFLTNIGMGKHPPFLEEIKARPMLKSISIPDELSNSWLSLYTLPNDTRLWGVTRNSVLAEFGTGLQTMIVVPEPYFIEGPSGLWQMLDGTLTFFVQNKITGSSSPYSLVHVSRTVECKATLNANKPISLGND